jgi:hypothetical protein
MRAQKVHRSESPPHLASRTLPRPDTRHSAYRDFGERIANVTVQHLAHCGADLFFVKRLKNIGRSKSARSRIAIQITSEMTHELQRVAVFFRARARFRMWNLC